MGMLNFDARTVAPSVGLDPVPEGWYKTVISKSNIKATKDNESGYLELILSIIEGQYQGRILYWNLNLWNKSQQATEIAYKQLSAISHVTGVFQVNDQPNAQDNATPMLHNIPFMTHAIVKHGNSGPQNEIKGVKDLAGNDPGKQGQGGGPPMGQPVQQPAQPAQPPAQAWGQPQGQPAAPPAATAPAQPAWGGGAPQTAAPGPAPGGWQPQGQPAQPAQPPAQPQGQPSWQPPGQGGAAQPAAAPWGART